MPKEIIIKPRPRKECLHIQDIPYKYFPKKTKARNYRDELTRMMGDFVYTNEKVQYSTQICSFNIKSIMKKTGYDPRPPEVFREIQNFVYHYENFCFRAFCLREKLLQFINAIIPVGYDERDVRIKHLIINPIIKQTKLLPIIKIFKSNKKLSKIIDDRNKLTHKLYYGKKFDHYLRPKNRPTFDSTKDEVLFKKWCSDWKKEIETRAKLTNYFTRAIFKINHELAPKIIKYKNSHR